MKDYHGDNRRAADANLNMPGDLAIAPAGAGSVMAITDFGNNAVRTVTPGCS